MTGNSSTDILYVDLELRSVPILESLPIEERDPTEKSAFYDSEFRASHP